jgi:hypothetical protein
VAIGYQGQKYAKQTHKALSSNLNTPPPKEKVIIPAKLVLTNEDNKKAFSNLQTLRKLTTHICISHYPE